MKNHSSVIACNILYLIGISSILCSWLLTHDPIWRTLALIFFLICSFIRFSNARCPHCNRFGCSMPFKKKAEYCKHCGQLIEYK